MYNQCGANLQVLYVLLRMASVTLVTRIEQQRNQQQTHSNNYHYYLIDFFFDHFQ